MCFSFVLFWRIVWGFLQCRHYSLMLSSVWLPLPSPQPVKYFSATLSPHFYLSLRLCAFSYCDTSWGLKLVCSLVWRIFIDGGPNFFSVISSTFSPPFYSMSFYVFLSAGISFIFLVLFIWIWSWSLDVGTWRQIVWLVLSTCAV